MDKKRTIFLTGATGFLGSYLLKVFLQNGHRVYAFARPRKDKSGRERVANVLRFWDGSLLSEALDNVTVVEGDITVEGLALKAETKKLLLNEVDEIFHTAAVTNLNYPLDAIKKINVIGTSNVLDLGLELKKSGRLIKANHISTAYIYGNYSGVFKEESLDLGQKFNTTYEQSKYEAEKTVGEFRKKGLWVDIYRPPIIMAHSKTGKAFRFRNIYQLLHICSLRLFDILPITNPYVNIIPVDLLCEAVYIISNNSQEKNNNYHPFPFQEVAVKDIVECGCGLMGIKPPRIVDLVDFDFDKLTAVQRIILENNTASLEFKGKLNSEFTLAVLKQYGFSFPSFDRNLLTNLLEYFVKEVILKDGDVK